MLFALLELGIFTAKAFILVLMIIIVLVAFMLIVAKSKGKNKSELKIEHLNAKYRAVKDEILSQTLDKKAYKTYLKQVKVEDKALTQQQRAKLFVITFEGDLKASTVPQLADTVTAILTVATPADEVVVKIDSPGGVVNGYGLAAAQLLRLRQKNIPLTAAVDKMAASGGYMMACVANKIIAAPFAILGSIGVIVQLPNMHRWLKEHQVDFEQQTAGQYKRTLTIFGENTEEGRQKLQEEIEEVHGLFKQLIETNRPGLDINKVATGEHWLGQQALALKLVDSLQTSDDYLLMASATKDIYEISYTVKKPLLARIMSGAMEQAIRMFSFPLN